MNRFFRTRFLTATTAFAALCVAAPAFAADTLSEKDAKRAAETTLTARNLRAYLTFIASDELAGRDTPSNGLDTAARYISTFLERWGFTPKGDNGTFYQTITLKVLLLDTAKSAAVVAGRTLQLGDDFVPTVAGETGNVIANPVPLVYVGHGWRVNSKSIDAYKGVDVRGKIVVVLGGRQSLPAGVTFDDLPRAGRGTDWISPDAYAKQSGAVGVIRVSQLTDTAAWAKQTAQIAPVETLDTTPVSPNASPNAALPAITISPGTATALFAGETIDLATARANTKTNAEAGAFVFSASKTATLNLPVHIETARTQNVVAAWDGGDDRLKNEYVALGAHYDHIGVSDTPGANGDRINNGADDDGSGTVALLSIAETLASRPDKRPKRSLLFVWHCGEEKGLWGSAHFTQKPTVPITSIVTQLNIDMIGRSKAAGDTAPRNKNLSDPGIIFVIGSRMISPELGDIVEQVNRDYTRLLLDYRYDDPKDPNQFYRRSDHYNYAKLGIPIAFFFDGVHADYHRVSDEVGTIDFAKYERVTRTIFVTAIAVANREKPLSRK